MCCHIACRCLSILGAALSNLSTTRLSEANTIDEADAGWSGLRLASLMLVALVAGRQAASAPSSAKDDARGVAAYLRAECGG